MNLSSWKYRNVLTEAKGSYFNCSVWPIQIKFLKINLKSRAPLYKLTFNSRADSNRKISEHYISYARFALESTISNSVLILHFLELPTSFSVQFQVVIVELPEGVPVSNTHNCDVQLFALRIQFGFRSYVQGTCGLIKKRY